MINYWRKQLGEDNRPRKTTKSLNHSTWLKRSQEYLNSLHLQIRITDWKEQRIISIRIAGLATEIGARNLPIVKPHCHPLFPIDRCMSLESQNSQTITSFSWSGKTLVIVMQQVPERRADWRTTSAIYNAVAVQSTSESCRSNQFPSQTAGINKSFVPTAGRWGQRNKWQATNNARDLRGMTINQTELMKQLSIVAGYGLGRLGIPLPRHVCSECGAHPACCQIGTGSFTRDKKPGL
jgi:hypothetical protein